ncbi:putative NADH dehydrogenase/NAD(P)H nitroreductase [Gottschalkia purinilytica]|uniref:Putative NADH dehydrogenase/NAD(P)H nitroreductase n=1 Tax=Gottschalkia purinilytica TaxID=1503 RepID=A0A0L0W7P4_GOTPU|nr:nitroreductase family protein [Gottschalkia purinilytica]KNF07559.1 putative NADH dehydrogenase/NAD(P)H nitroreductase [Gottschalkia purinilytica]
MQFYEVIENRSSVKKFKEKPIDKDSLARIINASMMSPSWRNHTSYRIILVDDKNTKEKLASTLLNDTNDMAIAVKEAPIVAVVIGNPSDSGTIEGKEYYLVDAAIAMEHLVLAATSEGYGTCWLGSMDENKIKEALSVPNEYKVVAMTPIGEVEEYKPTNPKKDVREHIFLNSWGKAYTENDELLH